MSGRGGKGRNWRVRGAGLGWRWAVGAECGPRKCWDGVSGRAGTEFERKDWDGVSGRPWRWRGAGEGQGGRVRGLGGVRGVLVSRMTAR